MNPPKIIVSEVALNFRLHNRQIREIAKLGDVNWDTLATALRTIRRVQMPLPAAARIWGFRADGVMLRRHATAGDLTICNPGERHGTHNPRRVTIRAMLDLMKLLDRKECGKTG